MILMIDNYDSFTYILAQYVGEIEPNLRVFRNDEISLEDIEKLNPEGILISPGPCTPKEAGVSVGLIREFYKRFPILGVCLGHQSMGAAFGAEVVSADQIVHGKVSLVHHNQKGLFQGIPTPFHATRYHSLVLKPDSIPDCFEISAWTEDGTVMGIQHLEYPICGVQFHPESILTEHGKELIARFLSSLKSPMRSTSTN